MYESYYGFSERPFLLSPDPKFFFASEHHQRALSYLQYGLDQGEGFIVITGPIGAGKTTIARNLLNNIDGANIVAAELVSTKLSPLELLELIANEFQLDVDKGDKATLLAAIEQYLINLNSKGKRALLVVDEAQNLPSETIEELRMLSNFQLNNKPLLQSFLLGQEELKDIIQAPNMEQFRQRIIASCHLAPLNNEEVRKYILHRLHRVGCENAHLFSDQAYALIHEKTFGIPRKINIFVDRILLYGFLEELNTIDVDSINAVAEEMAGELTGSLHKSGNFTQNKQVITADTATSDKAESLKHILQEIEEILENSIAQKIKMVHLTDKLLKEKSNQLANKLTDIESKEPD